MHSEADCPSNKADLAEDIDQRSVHLMMAGFEALDLLSIGLVVTSAAGRLLMANRTASNILEPHDGLELTPRGRLRVPKEFSAALAKFLQEASHAEIKRGSRAADAVFGVPRSPGKRRLTLIIRPVRQRSAESGPLAPAALVFILDPGMPVEAAESDLHELYGLTASEARLTNLLMEGKTLNQCCDQLGIRRSTGRTHLQHLLEKVGAQRQSELAFLLLKSIGLIRAAKRKRAPTHPTRLTI